MDKHDVLKQVFGYDAFRPGQEALIDHLLAGRDVLGIMPTGAGKSLCYQIPAILLPGVTLVVSPLISLMKDQVNALTQAGVDAAFLNSALSAAQYEAALAAAQAGRYKIIYVAPERLFAPRFAAFAQSAPIDMVVVDEAHCVSQWGHDFRSSYLEIRDFVAGLARRPVLGAFTATATQKVREDIETMLALHTPHVLVTGFDRPNLTFEVRRPKNKTRELLALVADLPGKTGIVYCATRKAVEEVCAALNAGGVGATRYHAGLSPEERRHNQEDFVFDQKRVMVATNAFGMGIDKSNVGFVIHYNMPKNVESYYQEAGRAGRDGTPADCILLYSPGDVRTGEFLIRQSHAGEELPPEQREALVQNDLELLKRMTFYATGTECLRRYLLSYFGEEAPLFCGNCSNCNTQYDTVDVTVDAQKILSCVVRVERMGRWAGKKMIADILRGAKNEKIQRNGYETLPTYGIMAGTPEGRIRHIIDHLLREGSLALSAGEYPLLGSTATTPAALKGESAIILKLPREKAPAAAKGPGGAKRRAAMPEGADGALYQQLAALRLELARGQGVPAYVVFTDATLRDMSAKKPQNEEKFLDVSGVGEVKLRRYGSAFLEVIRGYAAEGPPEGE